ncbi:hypothetical protein VB690_14615 [Nodularia spumigena CH309]|nr:hypothetical protein [Nodularia spumigena CH309]
MLGGPPGADDEGAAEGRLRLRRECLGMDFGVDGVLGERGRGGRTSGAGERWGRGWRGNHRWASRTCVDLR